MTMRNRLRAYSPIHPIRAQKRAALLLAATVFVTGCSPGADTTQDETAPPITTTELPSSEASPLNSAGADPQQVLPPSAIPPNIATTTPQINLSANFIAPQLPKDADEIRAESRQLAELVVAQFPRLPDAYEVRARLHLMLGESQKAEDCWKSAIELDKDYIHAYYGLGEVAVLRNDPEQAAGQFEKVKALDSDYSNELYYRLSEAQHNLGNIDSAISILNELAAKAGDTAEVHLRLGQEYLANRNYERARTAFEKTLELSPELPRAQEGLGRALARLGESDRARELLQSQAKAREEQPHTDNTFAMELSDYAEKYKDIAQVFLANGDNTKGQLILEKSVLLDPTNLETWSSLLGLYQRTNQLGRAQSMSNVMCEKNAENAGAFFTSGVIHAKSGDATTAKEKYESVIELAPESDSGYVALARLLLQSRQQPKRILELTNKAVSTNPSAANYELLGQAQAINGQMQEARDSLSKAIELAPDNLAYKQAMLQLEAFLSQQQKQPK
ncbi:MAG: tetratricopeptide repeat protein [Aureliella sp.]